MQLFIYREISATTVWNSFQRMISVRKNRSKYTVSKFRVIFGSKFFIFSVGEFLHLRQRQASHFHAHRLSEVSDLNYQRITSGAFRRIFLMAWSILNSHSSQGSSNSLFDKLIPKRTLFKREKNKRSFFRSQFYLNSSSESFGCFVLALFHRFQIIHITHYSPTGHKVE